MGFDTGCSGRRSGRGRRGLIVGLVAPPPMMPQRESSFCGLLAASFNRRTGAIILRDQVNVRGSPKAVSWLLFSGLHRPCATPGGPTSPLRYQATSRTGPFDLPRLLPSQVIEEAWIHLPTTTISSTAMPDRLTPLCNAACTSRFLPRMLPRIQRGIADLGKT